MALRSTTSLKLPPTLKRRVTQLMRSTDRTAHGFMVEAIERQTTYEEQLRAFVTEAVTTDRAIDNGQGVYAANEVHLWLEQLANHRPGARAPKRPRPCRA